MTLLAWKGDDDDDDWHVHFGFKSLEQVKLKENDNERKDAREIDYESLLLGDVIGQGAFGLVRKAQMRSSKPWELWENVAVKMLKRKTTFFFKIFTVDSRLSRPMF